MVGLGIVVITLSYANRVSMSMNSRRFTMIRPSKTIGEQDIVFVDKLSKEQLDWADERQKKLEALHNAIKNKKKQVKADEGSEASERLSSYGNYGNKLKEAMKAKMNLPSPSHNRNDSQLTAYGQGRSQSTQMTYDLESQKA